MSCRTRRTPAEQELQRRLSELARRVRLPHNVVKLWSFLPDEDQRRVEASETVGPDIIDIWTHVHDVSPLRSVVDMAYEAEAIVPQEHDRLRRQIGEDKGQESNDRRTANPFIGTVA